MASQHIIKKLFNDFKGVNKRVSQLSRADGYATEILNATYLEDGSISKRSGFTIIDIQGDITRIGFGGTSFLNENFLTGFQELESLLIGHKLKKKKDYPVEILYTGSTQTKQGSAYINSRVKESSPDNFRNIILTNTHFNTVTGAWQEIQEVNLNLYSGISGLPNLLNSKIAMSGIEAFTVTNQNSTNFLAKKYPRYICNLPSEIAGKATAFHTPVDSKTLTPVVGFALFSSGIGTTNKIVRKEVSYATALGTLDIMPIYDENDISLVPTTYIYIWDTYNNERVELQGSFVPPSPSNAGSFNGDAVKGTFTITPTQKSSKYREFDTTAELTVTTTADTSRLIYHVLEDVPATQSTLFPSFTQNSLHAGKPYLENASTASALGALYIASYDNFLMKYDGQRIYRAGIPSPSSISLSDATSGSHPHSSNLWFKATLEFTDAKGNIIESAPCTAVKRSGTGANGTTVTVTFPTDSTGTLSDKNDIRQFCIPSAKIKNTQNLALSGLHILTVTPNTLSVGDTVIVKSSSPSAKVANKIVKIITNPTTGYDDIYFENELDALTYNNGETLQLESLRVNIYVSDDQYALYRKVHMVDFPNGNTASNAIVNCANFTGSPAFTEAFDVVDDLSTFTIYPEYKEIQDDNGHGLPPKAKYVSAHQNCLILGHIQNTNDGEYLDNPNQIVWTPNDQPEYFPLWNYSTIPADIGDTITGIRGLRDLFYVFQRKQIQALAGDFGSGALRNVTLSAAGDIGCVSSSSITEIGGNLLFLDEKGVYSVNSTNPPQEVSSVINTEFKHILNTHSFKLATGFDWATENKFLITIPKTRVANASSVRDLGTESSITFTFEYFRNAWTMWDNFDTTGGIVEDNNSKIFFASRHINDLGNRIDTHIKTINNSDSRYDYTDHITPINFTYKTNWEHLGEPTLFKRFLRLKVHSIEGIPTFSNAGFNLSVLAEKDFIESSIGDGNINFKDKISGYGEGEYGQDKFGASPWEALKIKLPSNKAKSYRINFSNNNINEGVLISGYELEIATPFRPEIKE